MLRPDNRQVYAVWSNKGGVGKTTISFHIATTFAEFMLRGWKVLVCDLCPQANISMAMLTPQHSTRRKSNKRGSDDQLQHIQGADVVEMCCRKQLRPDFEIYCSAAGYIQSFVSRKAAAKVPPEDFLVRPCDYNTAIPENVYLLCGDPQLGVSCEPLEQYRGSNPSGKGGEPWRESMLALREFIDEACDSVDRDGNWLVIIDTNPTLTTYTQLALVAADRIIMPVNADDFSKVAVKAMFDLLYSTEEEEEQRFSSIRKLTFAHKVKEYNVPLPRVGVVVNNRETIYKTRGRHPFGQMGEILSDTLFELFKKRPDCFIGGNKWMQAQPDEELRKRFVRTYTSDMKDFHSTGVMCTHLGVPMSVIADDEHQRLPAFESVSQKQGKECQSSVIELCAHLLRSLSLSQPYVSMTAKHVSAARPLPQQKKDEAREQTDSSTAIKPKPPPSATSLAQQSQSSASSTSTESDTSSGSFHSATSGTGMTVNEKDLPYSQAVIVTGVIGDEGAELNTGDVSVVYPPGALPSNTPVDMMVAFLPSGFRLAGGVSLSPQVTLGPYGENILSRPINLYLPLDIAEGSTVLVKRSNTECIEPLIWQDVPATDYVLSDGKLIITTMGSTVYQAMSCPENVPDINIVGYCLYFCLFERGLDGGNFMQLQCADEESVCCKAEGEMPTDPFSQVGTIYVRYPAGGDLRMDMNNRFEDRKKIRQHLGPYAIISDGDGAPLDESVYAHVIGPSPERDFEAGLPISEFPSSICNQVLEIWQWEVTPESKDDRYGCGRLTIQAGVIEEDNAVQQATGSTKTLPEDQVQFQLKSSTPRYIPFDLDWADSEPRYPVRQQSGRERRRPDHGKKRKPGTAIFQSIAYRFFDMNNVWRLADALLEGIEPQGGTAWIKALTAARPLLHPRQIAWEIMDHWYHYSHDPPYGGKLHAELRKILPRVAEDFREQLLAGI